LILDRGEASATGSVEAVAIADCGEGALENSNTGETQIFADPACLERYGIGEGSDGEPDQTTVSTGAGQ
jgi:hypothetical protein